MWSHDPNGNGEWRRVPSAYSSSPPWRTTRACPAVAGAGPSPVQTPLGCTAPTGWAYRAHSSSTTTSHETQAVQWPSTVPGCSEVKQAVRQRSFGDEDVALYHYRTHDGAEVDVVAEASDGRVGAVEIKSSATVGTADFRHLAWLRDLLDASGGRFVRRVVLYTGDQVLPFGDRLVAMPLAALWRPAC
ncbi:MAG TPA: DUF4143 domain-containing protein [Pseudonocardiaceae bacterium]|nr:DUF4143 domain-containing protein [Pseudonocardiaceae bacterium]